MDERVHFLSEYRRDGYSMTELCDRYGVSRKTGYKWVARYERDGAPGLATRSSRPHTSPQATGSQVVAAIVAERKRHPTWGGKKIVAVLRLRHPRWAWPAVSTANDVLKRHHLVRARRRRRRVPARGYQPHPVTAPNDVWTVDFKGQFRLHDGLLCYPLTICDAFSRYLLLCRALPAPTTAGARAGFQEAFARYGLPRVIRSDNGEPFAAAALARLSRLSVWWIRLGIYPELIDPASPQQNGAHERMHRTLKAEATRPVAPHLGAQQRRFTQYLRHYNHERPHEALGQRFPATRYRPSPRSLPRHAPPMTYPGHWEMRRVCAPGIMWWASRRVSVSTVLIGEAIGLEPIDDGEWMLHFGPLRLARFDERRSRLTPVGART